MVDVVKAGLVDGSWSAWFSRMERARLDADYDYQRVIPRAEAEAAVERAQTCVNEIERLLPALLAEDAETSGEA